MIFKTSLGRLADHLWTALTLLLALVLAVPAGLIVAAPFMESQPAFVYDRYGCPVPGIGPDQVKAGDPCAADYPVDPAADQAGAD